MKLDGTETHKDMLTPFDAHEQVTRVYHTHSAEEGYQPAKYEHQEYPKAIDHDDETGEPIIQAAPPLIQAAPPRSSRPAPEKPKE